MRLDETTLIEYSLGILDDGLRQDVERELATSPTMQAELRAIVLSLSGVAEVEEPLRPDERVRAALLASLESTSPFAGFVDRLATFFDVGTDRAREFLDSIAHVSQDPWQASGLPGISLLHLQGGPNVATADNCGLVYLEPGTTFPEHQHLGEEWALVLQGQCIEHTGIISRPGDLVHKSTGSKHSFRVLDDEPFVFAVVLYGGFQIVTS